MQKACRYCSHSPLPSSPGDGGGFRGSGKGCCGGGEGGRDPECIVPLTVVSLPFEALLSVEDVCAWLLPPKDRRCSPGSPVMVFCVYGTAVEWKLKRGGTAIVVPATWEERRRAGVSDRTGGGGAGGEIEATSRRAVASVADLAVTQSVVGQPVSQMALQLESLTFGTSVVVLAMSR